MNLVSSLEINAQGQITLFSEQGNVDNIKIVRGISNEMSS